MGSPDVEKRPFFFAVSGYKNTGKTTLIERLIPVLAQRGYKVAVIKHDGHDFECDVPGTDSYRHREAGACGTAVFSSRRFFISREYDGADEKMIASAFPDADVILIEGLKGSQYPKYVCGYPEKEPPEPELLADEVERLMREAV